LISAIATASALLVTLICGILFQGGTLFWFGPAAASSILLCIYHLHKSFKKPIHLPESTLSILLILFTGWCFLTVFWSDIPAISLIHAITISAAITGFYCYFVISNTAFSWQHIFETIIATGLILVAISLVQLFSGIDRPNALFINPNTLSAYLNLIILPTAGYFLISTKPAESKFLVVSILLLVYSQAITGSRGASYGQYIGLAMIYFVGRGEIDTKKLKQFLATYLSAFLLAFLTTSSSVSRIISQEIVSHSNARWGIWQGSINLLNDTPWYGSGVGTYWLLYPPYRLFSDPASGQNPHNDYLQYLIEAGIPGLALLVLLMGFIAYSWWKYISNRKNESPKRIEATALMAGITAIGFHSLFTFNLGHFSILFLIGLLLGRFLFVVGQTKSIIFLNQLSIRKSIFSLILVSATVILLSYFTLISTSTLFLSKARAAYSEGKMVQADKFNAISLSLYRYNDRAHLLYALIYKSIIKNIAELTKEKRLQFYNLAIEHIKEARKLNPLRPNSYFIQAQLIEEAPDIAGLNWRMEASKWYQQSLKADPRFILAIKGLANFYLTQNDIERASSTIYLALRYQYPGHKETLEFYQFAELVLQQSGNKTYMKLLKDKLQ
jgi:O-antigen ligase